jgi:hypothetical protein
VIEGTLEQTETRALRSFDDLYEVDAEARRVAGGLLEQLAVTT